MLKQSEFSFFQECFRLLYPQEEGFETCHSCAGGEECFVCQKWKLIADALQLKFQFT